MNKNSQEIAPISQCLSEDDQNSQEACSELASAFFHEYDLTSVQVYPVVSVEPVIMDPSRFLEPFNEQEVSAAPAAFQCLECLRSFKRKRYLNDHMKVHRSDRPFVCPECASTFKAKSHLNDHLRSHKNDRRYICPECGKGFWRSSILNQHMRSHSQERPYVCEHCLKGFTQSGNRNIHLKFHCKRKVALELTPDA